MLFSLNGRGRAGTRLGGVATTLSAIILASAAPATSVHAAPADTTVDATADGQSEDRLAARIDCPLLGPSQFIDSWGHARSGGRSHQGVDMIAERGTPIVAVRSGDALFKQSRLGGNAVWLTTPSGERYYYAHLEDFEGSSRTVVRGEIIGYVGSTGNAGGPHLHFETHPDGDSVNPFGAVFSSCVRPPRSVRLRPMQTAGDNASPTSSGLPVRFH